MSLDFINTCLGRNLGLEYVKTPEQDRYTLLHWKKV